MGQRDHRRELELDDDPQYERRAYQVRTVAAFFGALLVAAGLLGLLGGDGPLAGGSATSAREDLRLTYERFLQWRRPDQLHVQLRSRERQTSVAISTDYLESFEIQQISAEPESVTVGRDRTTFTFQLDPPGEVIFSLLPQELGRKRGVVHGPSGSSVAFTQLVYP